MDLDRTDGGESETTLHYANVIKSVPPTLRSSLSNLIISILTQVQAAAGLGNPVSAAGSPSTRGFPYSEEAEPAAGKSRLRWIGRGPCIEAPEVYSPPLSKRSASLCWELRDSLSMVCGGDRVVIWNEIKSTLCSMRDNSKSLYCLWRFHPAVFPSFYRIIIRLSPFPNADKREREIGLVKPVEKFNMETAWTASEQDYYDPLKCLLRRTRMEKVELSLPVQNYNAPSFSAWVSRKAKLVLLWTSHQRSAFGSS